MIPPRPRRMTQAKAAMKVGSMRGRVLRVMIRDLPITFQRDTMYPIGTPTMHGAESGDQADENRIPETPPVRRVVEKVQVILQGEGAFFFRLETAGEEVEHRDDHEKEEDHEDQNVVRLQNLDFMESSPRNS